MLDVSEETGPHAVQSAELTPWGRSKAKNDAMVDEALVRAGVETSGRPLGDRRERWRRVFCFLAIALAFGALVGAVIASLTPSPGGPPGGRRDLPGQRGPYHP